jgi:hypothetical protein
MQRGASFNLDALKAEMAKKMAEAEAASQRFPVPSESNRNDFFTAGGSQGLISWFR